MLPMNEKEMEEMEKAERREYFRKWREENKEKVKQYNKKYWRNRAMERAGKGVVND